MSKIDYVKKFLNCKRVEGCSERSMIYYNYVLTDIVKYMIDIVKYKKELIDITTDEIREYLFYLRDSRKNSMTTLDNVRRVLNSFYCWAEDEDYIIKSPMRKIHKIKTEKIIKEAYTEEMILKILETCPTIRDKAMVHFLLSTGVRVGELVRLNKNDINWEDKEIKVFGKGNKERIVYFNHKTAKYLQRYLKSRKDDSPALFVTERSPWNRMNIGGVEHRIRQLGIKAGLKNVYPHRFRRTFATMAIDKGMPIEQVQTLLGHEEIKTTQRYAMVKQKNVKIGYKRYME